MKNKPSTTVYISNLSYERDRNGVKALVSKFGVVKAIKIIVEPTTGQPRGMAFVEMGSIEEATKAIEGLAGQIVDGRTVKANFAIPQKEEKKFYAPKVVEKDLNYKAVQLAKKKRNEERRTANPLKFKVASKKKVTKKKS